MKTFWIRTASAAAYALLFMGAIFSGRLLDNHAWGVVILALFATFVALGCAVEYYRMAELMGGNPKKGLGYFFTACVSLGLCVLPMGSMDGQLVGLSGMMLGAVLAGVLLVATPIVLMVQLWHNSEHPFVDVMHTLLPVLYCAVPMGLMGVVNESDVLVMCVLMIWANDCFAYMGGSLVGRHKMWPKHSPGKTWEGTAIGVVCCMAVAVLLGPLFNADIEPLAWALMGLVCGVIGTLGDLVESMLKRSVGLKDSGNIMPGHGGFLDRFDSLLMVLPFVFVILFLV